MKTQNYFTKKKNDAPASVDCPAGETYVRRCGALYVSKRAYHVLTTPRVPDLFSSLTPGAALLCSFLRVYGRPPPREGVHYSRRKEKRRGARRYKQSE